MSQPSPLNHAQQSSLHVLGYLFLRMGHHLRAKKLFAALVAVNPQDMLAHRCLAAAYVGLKDGENALKHLEKAISTTPATKDAALFLLKAQALWLCGRADEARNAFDTYITTSGEHL